MQARRTSSSSLPPPSSPPSAPQFAGEAPTSPEAFGVPSPAQTLWTAPSPTQTLGHSSPELPPLPSLSALGNNPRTPSTVARNDRTDTSYYTASWGSPYRHPPPSFNRGRQASTNLGSDDLEEDPSNLQFGLEHLLPPRLEEDTSPNRFNLEHLIPRLEQNASPNQFNLEHLIPSRLPANLDTPTRADFQSLATPRANLFNNPSEEWVRQFLEGQWNPEKNDWWSDSSADTGLELKSTEEEGSPVAEASIKNHKTRRNNKTLNQQDFWRHFSKDQKAALGKMMASKYADPEAVSHSRQASGSSLRSSMRQSVHADKPPMSPKDANLQEIPKSADETPSKPTAPSNGLLVPPASTPRTRKKIMVKGKGCIISIPRDIPRGTPGYPPKPMSPAAVKEKLEKLERAGYDTRGFVNASTGAPIAQNRAIWPDEFDLRAEGKSSSHRVRVPRKADWDAYVAHLMEAKLAALGVSLGGEEEETPSPMSRQASTSQHPGLPFSPPLPTSSASSHRMRQGSIVSGNFPLGPSPGHMSRQSIASPAAFSNPRTSMHMHRHSTFSPSSFQPTASPSGTWSPANYFGHQGGRVESPGLPPLPLSRPDLSDNVSPGSPFGMRPNQHLPLTPTQKDDLLVQMQQQQQLLQAQLLLQQQQQQQQQLFALRPSSTLAEVPEDEAEEDEMPPMKHIAKPATEIAVPTPRGHRHNISANLEREANRDAEYHLEQAIDKQFDEGGDFNTESEVNEQLTPSNPVADSAWEGSRPVLHQPQPHSRAHSLAKPNQPLAFSFPGPQQQNPRSDSDGAKTNISDITNPSLEEGEIRESENSTAQHSKAPSQVSNSWKDSKFNFGKPASAVGSAMHSKHTSRSSISRLNGEAKEFKFNPAASFSPGSFSSGFSFTPALKSPADPPRSNNQSIDGISSFNVSAPAFKPDAPAFKPVAEAPVFKPAAEAPAFKPFVPEFKPAVEAPEFKPAVEAPEFKPAVEAAEFKPSASEFKPAGTNGSAFNFSAGALKPDAPTFNPGVPSFTPNAAAPAPTNFSSKIFGNVSISASDIVKPAKRSKAIPIVRPDLRQKTPEKEEEEEQEDESGRIMQADGRQKRSRFGREDGDDIPKFATQPILPSQSRPLGEAKQPQASKQEDLQVEKETVPEDKENLSPNVQRAESKSKSPEPLTIPRAESPVESALPTPQTEQSASSSRTPIEDRTPHGSAAPTPTTEEAPEQFKRKPMHRSSLSATAKEFEFRPNLGPHTYDFGLHVTKPSVSQQDDSEGGYGGPVRQESRSPATTFRPSDDGSYKTALESRRHMPYPESESVDFEHVAQGSFNDASFNDIDAVMKAMNDEGSDFGVERDESWEQSQSPRRTPHPFERNDLPPNLNLRSDAPSPSPRRLHAPRNVHASSTSINQDPFDDEHAGLAYESPVHRLNNAEEVPMSDWDEGLLSEGENKIQARSRFFDKHVDDLISRLLQSRLGPLERNLQGIQDSLVSMSQGPVRGRRSMSTTERLDSDADDEDDDIGTDSHYRNRSPRKDRRLEKIRSIVREALELHQPQVTSLPVPVPEPMLPEKIRDVVTEVLSAHQSQAAPVQHLQPENVRDIFMEALAQQQAPQVEHVPADQIRSIVEEAIVSHKIPVAEPVAEPIKPEDIRAIVAEAFALNAPQPVEHVKSDDIRAMVMEAFETHAPQPLPPPVAEQIWPDDIKAIVAEALTAHHQQTPAAEAIQPDTIRSIVAEALALHQPSAAAPEPVQPDMIRSIVAEALASQKPAALEAPVDIPQPQVDMSEIYQVIGSLKASIAQTTSNHLQAEDVRELIDDAFKRQNMEVAKREESKAIEEKDTRIAELESILKETTLRLDVEAEERRAMEAREADTAKLLRVTEEELKLLRESASDDENQIRALKDECEVTRRSLDAFHTDGDEVRSKLATLQAENEELKLKNVALENAGGDTRRKLEALTAENEALTFTLEEHRLSTDKWRNDLQEAHEETDRLRKAIEQARLQTEEATRVRESMRAKFEKMQQDMTVASGQAAAERAQWQKSDEAHMKRYEVLSARIEAEGRTRERLEQELERLETQEREGMRLRISLEQSQKHNAKLEEALDELRKESLEHQRNAERYERDMREARESAHVEIRRTRVLMEADIDAANNQVNIVRHDLESEVARVRAQLDNVRMDADTAKEKHELDLEAASDAKKQAVEEAMESKKLALLEQEQAFERRLEAITAEHDRILRIAREDKDRAESFHNDRLALADSRLDHFKDKVSLLEEKLSVAKEAASAAAAAASKSPADRSSFASGFGEKISPQALRESIAVLQEQLQERESRIESLEHELADVDTDAPAKLKERDTEIGWLRELLGVRIDDLNDLINALAQPSFNRETVRDAAIRIRTNLQMEQQEKERLVAGGQSFPTLATLSNFASPRAVQLAAAFGNWRNKGRDNAASALAGSSAASSRTQTPSRVNPPSAQSFLSGLMTPPTSNLRRTPELPSSTSRPQNLRSNSITSQNTDAGFPALGKQAAPSTPPLLRKASYDRDAEVEPFSESGFYDDESTVDGGDMTPIGLHFGQELRR